MSIFDFKSLRRVKYAIRCITTQMWNNFLPFSSLHSLKGADAGNGIRVFVPDVGMFIASLTIWLVCRNIVKKPDTEEVAQFNPDCENEELVSVTICVFLLRSPGPSLCECVESICRELWGSLCMRHKWALSLYRAARVTLLGRHIHTYTLVMRTQVMGMGVPSFVMTSQQTRNSLLVLSTPQLIVWPHCAVALYQVAKPKMSSPALQPTCSTCSKKLQNFLRSNTR